MAEAKKQNPAEPEQSVEEILQSIRRLLDEEGEPVASSDPAAAAPTPGKSAGTPRGSDVLELTEMLKDDGSVVNVKDAPVAAAPAPAPTPAPAPLKAATAPMTSSEKDVMKNIESAIFGEAKPAAAAAAPVSHSPKEVDIDSLLSAESAKAASSSMKNLAQAAVPPAPKPLTPSVPFRAGGTVEDLVVEALRPMLKHWLDTNLPVMVEKLVEKEIRKITANL